MRYWVQFLTHAAGNYPAPWNPPLIDACGDTSVFILDGRNDTETMRQDALKRAQRLEHWRKYAAFQLVTGPRLFVETRRGPIHRLTYPIRGV